MESGLCLLCGITVRDQLASESSKRSWGLTEQGTQGKMGTNGSDHRCSSPASSDKSPGCYTHKAWCGADEDQRHQQQHITKFRTCVRLPLIRGHPGRMQESDPKKTLAQHHVAIQSQLSRYQPIYLLLHPTLLPVLPSDTPHPITPTQAYRPVPFPPFLIPASRRPTHPEDPFKGKS